jgi:hypothetical protein
MKRTRWVWLAARTLALGLAATYVVHGNVTDVSAACHTCSVSGGVYGCKLISGHGGAQCETYCDPNGCHCFTAGGC